MFDRTTLSKKNCKRFNIPNKKKENGIFLQYLEVYLTIASGEPCVHFFKLDQKFSVHDGERKKTHISRRLTKSSVSSVNYLGELATGLARYVNKADPIYILGTSGCSWSVHFSRNHKGITIVLSKGRRREIPFGTQSCCPGGIVNEVMLPYNNNKNNKNKKAIIGMRLLGKFKGGTTHLKRYYFWTTGAPKWVVQLWN